jgi:hypothetical protein
LEASLLRFTLSEHFLNVDELLSQLKGGSAAGVKKKVARIEGTKTGSRQETPNSETQNAQALSGPSDLRSIKGNWQSLLRLITTKLGPGTGGLLSSAVPRRFEDGVLTLEFGPSAQMQKRMCESNGRTEQIEALLGEQFSTPVRLKFEIAAGEQAQAEPTTTQPRTGSQRRNELINDPAVKTVLMGLDATITGIEED